MMHENGARDEGGKENTGERRENQENEMPKSEEEMDPRAPNGRGTLARG